ncbi:MAG: serine hydrolase [Candidatus Pacearchaeota archaeon]
MEETQISGTNSPKKVNLKKIFTVILIGSILLNAVLILKILFPGFGLTGAVTLINPEIDKNLANNVESQEFILHYEGLKSKIEQDILTRHATNDVGFFIQDLRTGSWSGKNERMGFAPASLLKVPIMMAILKKVDRGELNLDDKLVIRSEDIDNTYPTTYEKRAGEEVTIEELLKCMITNSDNTAKNTLIRQLFSYEVDDVFKHVGIPNPYLPENLDKTTSPRDYSRFFKSLYYSTYLSTELSKFALKLTTNTQTENLIPEGVPTNVEVAHKFGIYNENELHDCGIRYHEKNPYILCVMTRNLGSVESADIIRKISKETYEFVDKK